MRLGQTRLTSRLTAMAAVLALVGACAQAPQPKTLEVVDLPRPPECAPFDPRQERTDAAVVKAAAEALARGGYPGLRRHVPALEQVVARTPQDVETYRSCKLGAALLGGLAATVAGSKSGDKRPVVIKNEPSPYPMANFLAGAYYAEAGDYARAAGVLEKASAMAPADPLIAAEYAHALTRVGRHQEAVTALDRVLEGGELAPRDRARLQRTRGFALIELNRLDDAEAAYRDALKLEPGHATALNQLVYIAQLRQGGPRRAAQTTTSGEARTTPPNEAP